ncbi:tumor necrosis factor ligand superfamily member 9 [Microtus ochrogaster]|uniref:Tumor necrosis factor ligand superfamily member 9 n=1 Tax=Microtus ochrogaster TaxID=79684 RepID=A0ABM0LR76_MICOH|nr:tumor necrosis factor ligand superfamily member 9 [Microtus ochrogaster]
MDQSTQDAEDAAEARHASSTVCPAAAALPAVAALPSDAALLAGTVRPENAEHPKDAGSLRVNVQDPELAWPSAPHSCTRCQLLYWLGALLFLLGVVCGLIVLFTGILTLPALTIPTSTTQGTLEKTSNLTVTPVSLIGYPITTGQGSSVFAKLQTKNEALLNNRTLRWHSQHGAGSTYLSQGLRYNDSTDELVVDQAGLYYVSLQLKLNPVSKNMDHKVRGQVSLVLQLNPRENDLDSWTLTVDLFPCSMEANLVQGSRSDLIHLKAGHRLSVELRAYLHGVQGPYHDWQLSQMDTTSFVLFLVKPGTS